MKSFLINIVVSICILLCANINAAITPSLDMNEMELLRNMNVQPISSDFFAAYFQQFIGPVDYSGVQLATILLDKRSKTGKNLVFNKLSQNDQMAVWRAIIRSVAGWSLDADFTARLFMKHDRQDLIRVMNRDHKISRKGLRTLNANSQFIESATTQFYQTVSQIAAGDLSNIDNFEIVLQSVSESVGYWPDLSAALYELKRIIKTAEHVKMLVRYGADPNYHGPRPSFLSENETPITTFCMEGNLEVVRGLLESGAYIDYAYGISMFKRTPLLESLKEESYFACTRFLVDNGASITGRGIQATSPIIEASVKENVRAMEFLIEKGVPHEQIVIAYEVGLKDRKATSYRFLRQYRFRSSWERMSYLAHDINIKYSHW